MRGVRTIVTGGAGFIGSHLVDALLARGDEVWVVDNLATGSRANVPPDATFVEADVREPLDAVFDDARPEACFHLAAQIDVRVSAERPAFDADVNVIGTIRVAEAARNHDTPIVFSSTGGAIYGEVERPARENDERRPLAPYGAAKLAAEEYLSMYNRLYGTPHCSLRYGNVYGPRQSPHGEAGVVAIFLGRLAEGDSGRIFGDGEQTRDYVYVTDVVRATLSAVGHAGVINIGTGVETPVGKLYELCRSVAGNGAEPEFAPARRGELERSVVDADLAKQELGWRAEMPLEDGIRATWEAMARTAGAQGR